MLFKLNSFIALNFYDDRLKNTSFTTINFNDCSTRLDRGEDSRKDAAAVILYTAEAATRCALDAIQLLGGNGYTSDYPTGRFLRDAKLYEIGAGTSEVRRMLIGREIFQETA